VLWDANAPPQRCALVLVFTCVSMAVVPLHLGTYQTVVWEKSWLAKWLLAHPDKYKHYTSIKCLIFDGCQMIAGTSGQRYALYTSIKCLIFDGCVSYLMVVSHVERGWLVYIGIGCQTQFSLCGLDVWILLDLTKLDEEQELVWSPKP
jgi:hypothetical protein